MADHIRVSTAELERVARELDSLQGMIEDAEHIIAGVDTSKSSGGDLRIQASGPLVSGSTAAEVTRSLRSALRKSGNAAGSLADSVRKSAELFERTEEGLCRDFGSRGTGSENNVYDEDKGSGGGDSSSPNSKPWDWFGYEVDDDKSSVTGWLGRFSAETKGKWGSHAGVNAYFGKGKAKFDIDGNFDIFNGSHSKKYKDGKWTESDSADFFGVSASAGISGSILAADANAGFGDDMFGGEINAEGGLLNGTIEGSTELSMSKDGKLNAYAKGKAMVSAAEGEVSGTIDILGFEIKGTVGGYAGALGAEGKIGMENGAFVMKGGAAAVLGFSAGIEVRLNDKGWENLGKYYKYKVGQYVDFARYLSSLF